MERPRGLVAAVLLDEPGALDEHATGTGSRVEDPAVERLNDLNDQADDGRRCEVLPALRAFGDSKLPEEVLVDLAEGVALNVAEDRVHRTQQVDEGVIGECLVGPREDAPQGRVLLLDGRHRIVDRFAEVVALLQLQQVGEPCLRREVEHPLGLEIVLSNCSTG